nr:YbhB/YbcL family Raf kinase inhibitor-like protein [Colwellia sp. PAMC 21821]
MSKVHEFNGYNCSGGDLSPHLKWSDAPKGTKSFAITAYDPDTYSGSGWWHWQVINIPITVMEIPTGAGSNKNSSTPIGSTQIENDFSIPAFSGACPLKVMVCITIVLPFMRCQLKRLNYPRTLLAH